MKRFITFLMCLSCIFLSLCVTLIENRFKIELGVGIIFCIIFAYAIPLGILRYYIDKYIDDKEKDK
jgi:lipopolysaccharide export LptBFGC system permease protein LptF